MTAYNALLGSPSPLPFTVTGPNDTFRFGDRAVLPNAPIPSAPRDGLTGLLLNGQTTLA